MQSHLKLVDIEEEKEGESGAGDGVSS